jgi:hypothetical protein
MRIHRPTHTKKTIGIISILIIALILISTATAYYLKTWPFATTLDSSINLNEATQEEKDAGTRAKEQSLDNSKTQVGSDPAPAPQPIEGSDKKSVHMEITASNQDQSNLYVRSMIQTVTNTGTCTLTMTHSSHTSYTATADVQALSSSTTCKGFNVPLEQLTKGTWKITLSFTNDELTASTEKDVTIQ